jgi:hypothetical protein
MQYISKGRLKMKIRMFTLFVCICVLFIIGCTNSDKLTQVKPEKDKFTHVLNADVPYYSTGPQQAKPPDGTFKAGSKVVFIQDAGSYSEVETEDGIKGFVSTDALKPIK